MDLFVSEKELQRGDDSRRRRSRSSSEKVKKAKSKKSDKRKKKEKKEKKKKKDKKRKKFASRRHDTDDDDDGAAVPPPSNSSSSSSSSSDDDSERSGSAVKRIRLAHAAPQPAPVMTLPGFVPMPGFVSAPPPVSEQSAQQLLAAVATEQRSGPMPPMDAEKLKKEKDRQEALKELNIGKPLSASMTLDEWREKQKSIEQHAIEREQGASKTKVQNCSHCGGRHWSMTCPLKKKGPAKAQVGLGGGYKAPDEWTCLKCENVHPGAGRREDKCKKCGAMFRELRKA